MTTEMQLSLTAVHAKKTAMLLTPPQLRAARALLDWTRKDLAEHSGTAPETVQAFEIGTSDPKLSTLRKWRLTLQKAGVLFTDPDDTAGAGVRLKRKG